MSYLQWAAWGVLDYEESLSGVNEELAPHGMDIDYPIDMGLFYFHAPLATGALEYVGVWQDVCRFALTLTEDPAFRGTAPSALNSEDI